MTLQLTGKVKPECPLLDREELQYGWGVEISPKAADKMCTWRREALYKVPYENKHVPDMQLHLDIRCQKKKPFTGKCLLFSLSNDQVLRKGVKGSPWRLSVSVQPLTFKGLGIRTQSPLMRIFTSCLHMLSHLWLWKIHMWLYLPNHSRPRPQHQLAIIHAVWWAAFSPDWHVSASILLIALERRGVFPPDTK